MSTRIAKKISSIFLIISTVSTHSSIKADWRTFLHDLYAQYTCHNEKIVKHCRTTYATIGKDVQTWANALLLALKNRIALLKEHDEEYHNWADQSQKELDVMKHSLLPTIQCSPTPFSRAWTNVRNKVLRPLKKA